MYACMHAYLYVCVHILKSDIINLTSCFHPINKNGTKCVTPWPCSVVNVGQHQGVPLSSDRSKGGCYFIMFKKFGTRPDSCQKVSQNRVRMLSRDQMPLGRNEPSSNSMGKVKIGMKIVCLMWQYCITNSQ